MKNEEFIQLCIKEISGDIDKVDSGKLKKIISESTEKKREYENLKLLWEKTAPGEIPNMPNIENEWQLLSAKLSLEEKKSDKETFFDKVKSYLNSIFAFNLKPVGAAAVVVIIAIVGSFLFLNKSIETEFIEIATPNAVTQNVILPDGSAVLLNSGSQITYSNPFDADKRLVELEGEAFFSVTKNGIPFVIQTKNAKVSVLGTEFNVWSRDEKTKVIVESGKVELSSILDEKEKVTLTKNEFSEVVENRAPLKPVEVNSKYLLGWLNSELVFDRTPLTEVAGELERHYNISITFESSQIKNLTLTGTFDQQDPDSVLTIISTALGVDFIKESNKYVLQNN